MSDQAEAKQFNLHDVALALEIVGLLLTQLTIPAARSQEFAVVGNVIGELKTFVHNQIAKNNAAAEAAPEASADVSSASGDAPEAAPESQPEHDA